MQLSAMVIVSGLFLFGGTLFCQGLPSVMNSGCAEATPILFNPRSPIGDGADITAHGPLKILIIMTQFLDDDYLPADANWPLDNANGQRTLPEPAWVADPTLLLVPPHTPFIPVKHSLSDFYATMSKHSPSKPPL